MRGRVYLECREVEELDGCSLRLEGREDEVMIVAIRHAVEGHDAEDGGALHRHLRHALRQESAGFPEHGAYTEIPAQPAD